MKIIVFGSSGQLGLSFMKKVPKKLEIITPLRSEIDLSIEDDIEKFIFQHNPKIILNFAAFTDVDKAETHQKLETIQCMGPMMAKIRIVLIFQAQNLIGII